MKSMVKFLGIIAFVVIAGFYLVSCDTGASRPGGGDSNTGTTVAVTGVTLNKQNTFMVVGGTEPLTATVAPANATNRSVTWSSSDDTIATVSAAGVVTAVAEGIATITVTTVNGGFTDYCIVDVSATPVPVTGVSLDITIFTLNPGGTQQLTETITPFNATNQNVTWISDAPAIATVSASGEVTAVSPGTATITVTTVDGGHTADSTVNVTSPVLPTYSTISAGEHHTVALRADGTLWAWGRNHHGQLGDGTTTDRQTPVHIAGSWISVSAGDRHTAAIRADGTLWAWGWNAGGQLGDGTTTDRHTPVQIGSATWAYISAGHGSYTMAIRTDGTLWAWGNNTWGQLGDGTSGISTSRHTPFQIGSDTWTSVSAGASHTMAIRTDGTLWAWGANGWGLLGDGTTTNRNSPVQIGSATWNSVSAGMSTTVAVKADGTLWSWGLASAGQLGDGTTTDRNAPVQICSDTNWASVSVGLSYTVAVRTGGTLWAWGSNHMGQLGDGTTTDRHTPVQIGLATDWAAASVAGGAVHNIAIRTDGTLWAWGSNQFGQLGDGTTTNRHTPVQVFF